MGCADPKGLNRATMEPSFKNVWSKEPRPSGGLRTDLPASDDAAQRLGEVQFMRVRSRRYPTPIAPTPNRHSHQ
jgi:hypothetical protein